MIKIISLTTLSLFILTSVYAAEAGMPQLDPTYWASQVFWLTLIFSAIYFLIAKIFVPKIKGKYDARESQIRKDINEANSL
jgi:F0F1-type ATP synthase, subunit b